MVVDKEDEANLKAIQNRWTASPSLSAHLGALVEESVTTASGLGVVV